MDFDLIWRSRLEGIIAGIVIICVPKALICYEQRFSMKCAAVIWLVVNIFELASLYIQRIPLLYVIHIPTIQVSLIVFRVIIIIKCIKRIQRRFKKLRFLKPLAIALYVLVHGSFAIVFTMFIRCEIFSCSRKPSSDLLRALDFSESIIYIIIILVLDLFFVISFSIHLYTKEGGMNTLLYSTNLYHMFLQVLLFVSVGVNLFRIVSLEEYSARMGKFSSLWLYPDTFILLMLLEYGVCHKDIVKRSKPDTTEDLLELERMEKATVEEESRKLAISKTNLIRFLHHGLRNNIQKLLYILQEVSKASDDGDLETVKSTIVNFENIINYITVLIEDVHLIEDFGGEFNMETEIFDIVSLLKEELHFVTSMLMDAQDRFTRFHIQIPESMFVQGDPRRLRQVMRVLSEIFFETVIKADFSITVNEATGYLVVDVDSSYPIILHTSERPLESGQDFYGVSLLIATKIVEAMNGEIITSEDHKHFSMRVQFPLVQDDDREEDSSPGEEAREKEPPPRILIVDDSNINRKMLRKMVENLWVGQAIALSEADNGQAAIDEMEKVYHDIIFLDVVMPVMDGITACRELKTRWPNCRIIMVTANDKDSLPADLVYDGFIQKPLRRTSVEDALQQRGTGPP
jgi:CheY-like chemotaxis protein/signal transduction histidine kinase